MKRRLATRLLCVAPLLWACGDTPDEPTSVVRSVLTTVVSPPNTGSSRTFSGVAQSRSEKELSFRVGGEVAELRVDVGDVLDAATVVARLDDSDYAIDVREARASAAEVRARKRNDDAAYSRTRALYGQAGATKEDLDQARATAESTNASLLAAVERLRLAERQLEYTTLRAPVEGAVSRVPIEIGENVSAGQAVIVFQTGVQPEVEVAIPESLIANVEEGGDVEVEFDALRGERFTGRVVEVAVTPTSVGSAFPVTVALDAEWDPIRPGLAARATFRFDELSDGSLEGVVVPPSAIGHDQKGHFVFLVEDGGDGSTRTVRRSVEVGAVAGEGIVVLTGLAGGETIVVAGVPRIRDGLMVRVLDRSDWF